ncbi:MAG: gliding motility-associated C-terminal domain-containing protein [Saprospiraceae bacterium]
MKLFRYNWISTFKISLIFTLGFLSNFSFAQNLGPNPSFEKTTYQQYDYPFNAFLFLEDWYPAAWVNFDSSYLCTADLFDNNNKVPPPEPQTFWNIRTGAAQGDKFVGLVNEIKKEGFFRPEAVGAKLNQALEAGSYYLIDLAVRNKGTDHFFHDPEYCLEPSYQHLDIWFDTDSIFLFWNDLGKNSYTVSERNLSLFSSSMESRIDGVWKRVGTCFQAKENDIFMAIAMTSGRFDVIPPCEILEDHWDFFYTYYFDIDDVHLYRLPEQYEFKDTICEGRETAFNIAELLHLPTMQRPIQMIWPNGQNDSVQYLNQAGKYKIDLVLDCKTIPIYLELEGVKCSPEIYVPNAFSPNGDGINDALDTYIHLDLPLVSYSFKVFDRWGSLVFESKDITKTWDGTYKNKDFKSGTFSWVLEISVKDPELGIRHFLEKGAVDIIK